MIGLAVLFLAIYVIIFTQSTGSDVISGAQEIISEDYPQNDAIQGVMLLSVILGFVLSIILSVVGMFSLLNQWEKSKRI